jgi:hypothetical protein
MRRLLSSIAAFGALQVSLSILSLHVEAFVLHSPPISFMTVSSITMISRCRTTQGLKDRSSNDNLPSLSAAKKDAFYDDDDENKDVMLTMTKEDRDTVRRRDFVYNALAIGLLGASGVASYSLFQSNVYTPSNFQRLARTQFIAALGNPESASGSDADSWGLWEVDPGPRGVWLRDYQTEILQSDIPYQAPAGWTFDPNNWWLEEHGLIMESPTFPLSPGRYLVTGGRMVTTGLTIDKDGGWKLDEGKLYDVTHLPCRSAVYHPITTTGSNIGGGTPSAANPKDFPVTPGAEMPSVQGCTKQDYAVLFVVGKAV